MTTFCYLCSTYQSETTAKFNVRQAIDCSIALNAETIEVTGLTGADEVHYDVSSTWKDDSTFTTIGSMITNTVAPNDCGVITCTAMENTCATAATNVQIVGAKL